MLHTILVPLDGSSMSEQALLPASRLAQTSKAKLILVRASWSPDRPEHDPMTAQMEAVRGARAYLEGVATSLRHEGLEVETCVPFALAATGVLREIDLCHADLVIMASHRRPAPDHQIYGSVARAVLAQSRAPVLVMRVNELGQPDAKLTDRPRLLVPLDGSALSEAVLPSAIEFARTLDWSMTLLRVLPERPALAWGPGGALGEEASAISYLVGVAAPLRKTGMRIATIVQRGSPADAILDVSHQHDTCVIAMTTHGQTGLREMLFGSVAMTVLSRSELPLLLVRIEDAPQPVTVLDSQRLEELPSR